MKKIRNTLAYKIFGYSGFLHLFLLALSLAIIVAAGMQGGISILALIAIIPAISIITGFFLFLFIVLLFFAVLSRKEDVDEDKTTAIDIGATINITLFIVFGWIAFFGLYILLFSKNYN